MHKMNRIKLFEYTFNQVMRKQRSITSLFPTFNDRVKKVASNGGARFVGTDGNKWNFTVTSGTETGLKYDVIVELIDVEDRIREIINSTKDVWVKEGSYVDYRKLADILIDKVDLRWQCSCPAFQYWGPAYILTQRNAKVIPPPEDRAPRVRNPKEYGAVCKHLQNVLKVFPFYVSTLAKWLKVNYSEVVAQEEAAVNAERGKFKAAGEYLGAKEEPVSFTRGGKPFPPEEK